MPTPASQGLLSSRPQILMSKNVERGGAPNFFVSVSTHVQDLVRLCRKLLLNRSRAFAGLVGLTLVSSVAEALGIALVLPLVSALQGQTAGKTGFPGSWLPNGVVSLTILVAAAFLLKNALVLIRQRWSFVLLFGLWQEWVRLIVDNLLLSPLDRREKSKSGRIIATALVETRESVRVLLNLLDLMVSFLTLASIYAVLLLASWRVTLAVTVLVMAVGLLGLRPLSRAAHGAGLRAVRSYEAASNQLLDILGGLPYIKMFGREEHFAREMSIASNEARQAFIATRWLAAFVHPVFETGLVVLLSIGIILFARTQQAPLPTVLPILGVFAAASFRIFPILTALGTQWVSVISQQPSVRRVIADLGAPIRESSGDTPFDGLRQGIVFRNLWFRYSSRTEPALRGISFELPRGKKTVLVGESGAGKSTVVSLLLGFLRPDSGEIEVDGVPLEELLLQSWRSHIGYVGQHGFVFHTTIEENITLGRTSGSQERVEAVARAVGLEQLVDSLPDRYHTVVGERGGRLSGGQQQRLALARALYADPEILVLDEGLNALDNESAKAAMRSMSEFLPQATWIVVGHRVSQTVGFDQILVLRDGRVVERGTHQELMNLGGYYRDLFEIERATQNKHEKRDSQGSLLTEV
jgi:ATP-binding cassette, subfamily B, bacterial MsbA